MSTALLQFAHRSWPAVISVRASMESVAARRLSGDPLYRIASDGKSYALRGWNSHRLAQANAAGRFVRHLAQSGEQSGKESTKLCVASPILSAELRALMEFQDHHWELTPWLAGESDFAQHPSCERVVSMCESLAHLHQQAAMLEVPPLDTSADRRGQQLKELASRLDAGELVVNHEQLDLPGDVSSSLLSAVRLVQQRVSRLPMVPTERQWIWGDAWFPNFLFDGDQVVGLVDFATVRVDTPLADLARLLGSATTDHPDWWQAGLESYARWIPLSPADRDSIRLLTDVGTVLSLGNWLRWLGVEQREFANPGEARRRLHHFHQRLTELLARRGPP